MKKYFWPCVFGVVSLRIFIDLFGWWTGAWAYIAVLMAIGGIEGIRAAESSEAKEKIDELIAKAKRPPPSKPQG